MLYLFLDSNKIKILNVKKSLLGQYTIGFCQKEFKVSFLKEGKITNMDVFASALKETLTTLGSKHLFKEKQVYLILPQPSFYFLRTEVSKDITSSAIVSFLKDKVENIYGNKLNNTRYDYFFIEGETQKYIHFYAIEESTIEKYEESLKLLDLEIVNILPETLAYFKLFEKTLRKGKIEYILYGEYEKNSVFTYFYDSFGLLNQERNEISSSSPEDIQKAIKQKGAEYEKKGKKINRLILSGSESEKIRQDTFTKETGMWTNPLKRIIPQFYQDYLKLLVAPDTEPFPLLQFGVCFGAFVFSIENKLFSPLKKRFTKKVSEQSSKKTFSIPVFRKEILLFVGSFVVSFILFSLISKTKFTLPSNPFAQPTKIIIPTIIPPSPTPTPLIEIEKLKIKVLNGSGTKGKASELKDILKEKKYVEILTDNADNFDYKITEIHVKKGNKNIAHKVADDIKEYTPKATILDDNEKETADVIIIIGQDFK